MQTSANQIVYEFTKKQQKNEFSAEKKKYK